MTLRALLNDVLLKLRFASVLLSRCLFIAVRNYETVTRFARQRNFWALRCNTKFLLYLYLYLFLYNHDNQHMKFT